MTYIGKIEVLTKERDTMAALVDRLKQEAIASRDAQDGGVDLRKLAEETGIRVDFAQKGNARLVQIIDIIHYALLRATERKE